MILLNYLKQVSAIRMFQVRMKTYNFTDKILPQYKKLSLCYKLFLNLSRFEPHHSQTICVLFYWLWKVKSIHIGFCLNASAIFQNARGAYQQPVLMENCLTYSCMSQPYQSIVYQSVTGGKRERKFCGHEEGAS